jgi:putative ABC transport system permease protein
MRWMRRILYLGRRRRAEDELAEEMAAHRAMARDALERDGLGAAEARDASQRTFGNDALAMNRARDVWVWPRFQDISQDVRFAVRMLVKDRRFTFAAVAALALGIGVNASVFAVINAALFKDMPFEDPARLVAINTINAQGREEGVPVADLADYIAGTTAFEGLAASTGGTMNIGDASLPAERFRGAYITANTFSVLRVAPLVGRDFRPDDDRPGAPAVVLLGHGAWLRRYGADPSVVGRAVRVNGVPSVIVGVMPPDVRYPFIAEAWQPLSQAAGIVDAKRGVRPVAVVARLTEGSDLMRAQGEVAGIAARLATDFSASHANLRVNVKRLRDTRPTFFAGMLMLMMGAVVFVLLVACANLAALLLARSAYRSREVAIRASLGASRWRIVRQLLIECVLLSAAGGFVGLALARLGVQQIAVGFDIIEPGAAPGSTRPYWFEFSMDSIALAFVSLLCLVTTMAFGLLPSLHATRAALHDALKDSGRTATISQPARRWSDALMIAQLALTLVLLCGTGLLWREFLTLLENDRGVNSAGIVTGQVAPAAYATIEARRRLFGEIEERLSSAPDLSSAALASEVPLVSIPTALWRLSIGSAVVEAEPAAPTAAMSWVGDRYFETVGQPIVRGRQLSPRDSQAGEEGVIVNQRLTDLYFKDTDPIGQQIRMTAPTPGAAPLPVLRVVGVAAFDAASRATGGATRSRCLCAVAPRSRASKRGARRSSAGRPRGGRGAHAQRDSRGRRGPGRVWPRNARHRD